MLRASRATLEHSTGDLIMRRKSFASLVSFTLVLVSPMAYADRCVEIARIGLVDETHASSYEERLYRLFFRMRHEQEMTSSQARSLAAEASIPLGEILLGAGGEWNDNTFTRIRQMDEQELHLYVQTLLSSKFDSRTANENVTNLVRSCLQQKGLAGFASYDENRRAPALVLEYERSEGDFKSIDVELSMPAGLDCGIERPTVRVPEGSPKTLSCARTSKLTESVMVAINPKRRVNMPLGGEVWFPPASLPPAPCLPVPTEDTIQAIGKERPARLELGPYCEDVQVRFTATGTTKRHTAGDGAYSRLYFYDDGKPKSADGTRAAPICSKPLDLPHWSLMRIEAICGSFALKARTVGRYTGEIEDRLANTYGVSWTIEVHGVNQPFEKRWAEF
jgi:hypothetical protein